METTKKEIMQSVLEGQYYMDGDEWSEVSDAAQMLVKKMLTYDPEERISAEEVLNDPWFKLVLGEEELDKPLAMNTLRNLRYFRVSYLLLINKLFNFLENHR